MPNLTALFDYRYNPFTDVFTPKPIGYSGNPVEEQDIADIAPYYIFLEELPRLDTPSTLLVNEKGGSAFTEVSKTTPPAVGQFHVIYGGNGILTTGEIGQGLIEFNAADAGKTMEIKYYGLGSIIQKKLFTDIFVDVISTQEQFNDSIERVAANQYKFKDTFTSLTFSPLTGGYQVSGMLSGGDTWGYIETNNCANLEFQSGAFLDFENERGYIEVNTIGAYLKNVDIQGTGTVASAITRSFVSNAERVIFENCKVSNRLSNAAHIVFLASSGASTSTYTNCQIFDIISSSGLEGFKTCQNLANCQIYDSDSTASTVYGFRNCISLKNCIARDMDANSHVWGFEGCENGTGLITETLTSAIAKAYGYASCDRLSNCSAKTITGDLEAYGFQTITIMSGCETFNIKSVTLTAYHFRDCVVMAGCYSKSDLATGTVVFVYNSDSIAGFRVVNTGTGSNRTGFELCEFLTGIQIGGVTTNLVFFESCTYGAAIGHQGGVPNSPSNDWMDTVDANITNKVSTPSIWT